MPFMCLACSVSFVCVSLVFTYCKKECLLMLYLEVVVLVDGASGVRGHVSHGCNVYILARKEEEIHTAALRHTVLRQLLVHSFLRLEQGLRKKTELWISQHSPVAASSDFKVQRWHPSHQTPLMRMSSCAHCN